MMAMPNSVLLRRNFSRKTPSSSSRTAFGSFLSKEVFLHDWWLIKADKDLNGKRLGIGGVTCRESQGKRVFKSTPICKRYDAVTLKTGDGITVIVQGHLNRSRTVENGISQEVCDHFVFGFPYYWEEVAALSFDKQPANFDFSKEISGSDANKTCSPDSPKSFLPVALDDHPVTAIRDLFMIAPGDSGGSMLRKSIFDDILQKFGGSSMERTPLNSQNMRREQKLRGDSDVLDAEPRTKKNKRSMNKNGSVVEYGMPGMGPMTRSRTRLKQ